MRRHIYYTLQSLLHKQGSNAIKIVSLALGLLMSVFLIVSSICLTTNQEFIAKFFAH